MSSLPLPHHSVRILLINESNEILLMSADDPSTTSADGTYRGRFWFLIGGEIEPQETLEQAAIRELYEETGLIQQDIVLGPVVWYGAFDLVLSGKLRHLKQRFIVAKTKNSDVHLENLTPNEQKVIQKIDWFSLEKIKNCPDIIYPIVLPQYLPDILAGHYPEHPIEIALDS